MNTQRQIQRHEHNLANIYHLFMAEVFHICVTGKVFIIMYFLNNIKKQQKNDNSSSDFHKYQ